MGILHYLKRELETAFVHVFSRGSMPMKRVFINCAHYWILFAFLNSLELYFFPSNVGKHSNRTIILLCIIWLLFEFCNYKCHEELSSFRKKTAQPAGEGYQNSEKKRGIPKTFGFQYVSCANYFWESLGWLTFSALTRTYASYLFTGVSIAQMLQWALQKHKGYKK